ncbi:hypothetical protein D3C87_1503040 [compost metagenome]
MTPCSGRGINSSNLGFLISIPTNSTFLPDNAKVAARFAETKVFPSLEKVEVTNIVLAVPSGTLLSIKSRFVLIIRNASAQPVLLSDVIIFNGESEEGTSPIKGTFIFPSKSTRLFTLVSNKSSV